MKYLLFALLIAAPAAAETSQCSQAKKLSSDYWAMVDGVAKILKACEGRQTEVCKIAFAVDTTMKEGETTSGQAAMLAMALPSALCKG